MKRRSVKTIFFMGLMVLPCSSFARAPLGSIKGTYTGVKEEYKRISPLVGVIWWYSGQIKNIYRFGDQTPFYSLVKSLFHEVPGQFTITQNPNYPAYYLDATSCAQLVIAVEDFMAEGSKQKSKKLSSDQKTRLKTIVMKNIEKQNDVKLEKNVTYFLDGIEHAYNASGYFDTKPNVFKYGLHAILLAFLYEKAASKKDLQAYLHLFDGKYFTQKEGDEGSVYTMKSIEGIEARFSKKTPENGIASLLGEASFEEYVYAQIMKSSFLTDFLEPTGYKEAVYVVNGNRFSFPDCMETTLRTLIDELARVLDPFVFNPQLKVDKKKLAWKIDPRLKVFYTTYPSPESTGVPSVHNAWTNVVSNRAFVTYKRINDLSKPTELGIEKPRKTDGFVIVPDLKKQIERVRQRGGKQLFRGASITFKGYDFFELSVGKRTYLLFDPKENPNLVAYEVKPGVRNLITMLFHLFGTKIFKKVDSNETWLERTLLKIDFNSTYLEPTFAEVGFDDVDDVGGSLDEDDLTDTEIAVVVSKNESTLKLVLSRSHGYANVVNSSATNRFALTQRLVPFFQKNGAFTHFKDVLLFALNKLSYEKIIEHQLHKTNSLQDLLLCLDLSSQGELVESVKTFLDDELLKKLVSLEQRMIVKKFWMRLIRSIPVVDGETFYDLAMALVENGNVRNVLLQVDEAAFKDDSFLTFFIIYFRTQDLHIKGVTPTWTTAMQYAIQEGSRRNLTIYRSCLVNLFVLFIGQKNQEVIDIADKILRANTHKKALEDDLILSWLLYEYLATVVYSVLPKKDGGLLEKRLRGLLPLIKKSAVYGNVVLGLAFKGIKHGFVTSGALIKRVAAFFQLYLKKYDGTCLDGVVKLAGLLFKKGEINRDTFFDALENFASRRFAGVDVLSVMAIAIESLESGQLKYTKRILGMMDKLVNHQPYFEKLHKEVFVLLRAMHAKKLFTRENGDQIVKIVSYNAGVATNSFTKELLALFDDLTKGNVLTKDLAEIFSQLLTHILKYEDASVWRDSVFFITKALIHQKTFSSKYNKQIFTVLVWIVQVFDDAIGAYKPEHKAKFTPQIKSLKVLLPVWKEKGWVLDKDKKQVQTFLKMLSGKPWKEVETRAGVDAFVRTGLKLIVSMQKKEQK